jgi:hypothetical protein
MTKVLLFAGTRKGGLVFTSDESRRKWNPSDLHFKAWNVMHMVMDPRDLRIHASAVHPIFGPSTYYSDDFGAIWNQAQKSPVFERSSTSQRPLGTPDEARRPEASIQNSEEVLKVWKIQPGLEHEPATLYAGVEPAALFKSSDYGQTWKINQALYDHPHRPDWFPGAGGLCLHTILPHPTNADQMWVAISTGGCYYTADGGQSWIPRNKNVRADFLPDTLPEYGQCVHKIVSHSEYPLRLYQQNHCGMYRSDDGGLSWVDIGEGKLPSRFGFPLVVHPHEPETIFLVPEESDQFRVSVNFKFVVWRSRDAGETWQPLTNGLPERAYLVVLRDAMATDTCDDAGIYIGTSTGQIFFSKDGGDKWKLLVDYLPPISSLEAIVIDN